MLPVTWLKPQVINGYSIISFCILELEGLTIWPLPTSLGLGTISCAYRCGVIDESQAAPIPSVFIVSRNTDRSIVSSMAPMFLRNAMPRVNTTISHAPNGTKIEAKYAGGSIMFTATVTATEELEISRSRIFDTKDEFTEFIHDGVASYAHSIYPDSLTRVDLQKNDCNYTEVKADVDKFSTGTDWIDSEMIFDSSFRATGGGIYKWTYLGLAPICYDGAIQEIPCTLEIPQ